MRAALVLLAALWPALATAEPRPVIVRAEPVEIGGGTLAEGVTVAGAWELTSDDPAFGGLSGLWMGPEQIVLVSDRGHLLAGRIAEGGDAPLGLAVMHPLVDEAGRALTGDWSDAEGLARIGETFLVAFERDHRIMRMRADRRLAPAHRPADAYRLPGNAGMEGLAALPGNRLLAIAEGREDGAFPVWLIGPEGTTRGSLPALTRHAVTGADLGPDGLLYLSQRFYSPAEGVSLRLLRYALGDDGMPVPESAETLAALDAGSGIDNMEGIAAVPGEGGGIDVWLVSDDNFNPAQRTLLLRLKIGGGDG